MRRRVDVIRLVLMLMLKKKKMMKKKVFVCVFVIMTRKKMRYSLFPAALPERTTALFVVVPAWLLASWQVLFPFS